jgi:VanZ family protein
MACVALAAWFTVLPRRINTDVLPIDLDELITRRSVARAAMTGACAAGVMLVFMAWRHRHEWRSRLSWPLVAWLLVCLGGLALLVVLSQPPWFLRRHGFVWFAEFARDFDMRHMVAYVGFAVVAALAWRDRLSLPIIGLLLMAYGFVLELAQELVPTRNFRIKDLVSNALGISLGLSWVYLYDLLQGVKQRATPSDRRRRERGRVVGRGGASAQSRRP